MLNHVISLAESNPTQAIIHHDLERNIIHDNPLRNISLLSFATRHKTPSQTQVEMPSRMERRWLRSDDGSDSGYSDCSNHSHSTAPIDSSRRPSLKPYHSTGAPYIGNLWEESASELDDRASIATYTSTIPSEEDFEEEDLFSVPDYEDERFSSTAIPSTAADFAAHFPSTRRLNIKHDDATLDGNMNLRIDTEIKDSEGHPVDLTLFHLRMHDLKNREFSLRRYCRDSGREVCHSSRKPSKKPGLQRSMSDRLSSLRTKSEAKTFTHQGLKRNDSGYGSLFGDELDEESVRESPKTTSPIPLLSNTIHLEFSNYAHVDIARRGIKSSKRYEFEYWGTQYAWKRLVSRTGSSKETSYHLVDMVSSRPIAHIVPSPMTKTEAQEEEEMGGWVPPCSMWISDERITQGLTDVAE